MILEGTILRGRTFEPVEGRLVLEDGEISAIEDAQVSSEDVLLPAFVNAHTHVGDSIAKGAGEGLTLAELVAPPDGLKHRLLREASREDLVAAMARTVRFMEQAGTAAFLDFREGGLPGVRALEAAAADSPVDPVILARESIEAMAAADGFGASGANDADFERERRATREAGKLFGIHAGEVDASDVAPALALEPDFLVHMVHATEDHLDRVADAAVPVVVCPRSNLATDVGVPPIATLHERTTVALGTDNVMLSSPSLFREMALAANLCDLPAREILGMATRNGAAIAGLDRGVLAEGRPASVLVLDGDSDNLAGARDPVRAVVRRASVADVERTVFPGDT